LQEGYVKGGSLCLKEIAEKLPENILTESLKEPWNQIQKNAAGRERNHRSGEGYPTGS
jgi:hypothetical protein